MTRHPTGRFDAGIRLLYHERVVDIDVYCEGVADRVSRDAPQELTVRIVDVLASVPSFVSLAFNSR